MRQELSFYLTLVLLKDEESGDYTAFYAQFPEASAQGKTQDEARKLLNEIFPHMLEDKKAEFLKYHPEALNKSIKLSEQKATA